MNKQQYFQMRTDPMLKKAVQIYCKLNFTNESDTIRRAVAAYPPIREILEQLRKEEEPGI